MSYFGNSISTILNTLYNYELRQTEFKILVDNTYSNIINGKITIPQLNFEFNELVYAADFTGFNFYSALTRDVMVDGVKNKVGFNSAQIQSIEFNANPNDLLENVTGDYNQAYIQLTQILEHSSANLNYYKYLTSLFNDIGPKIFVDASQFDQYEHTFEYIHNRSKIDTVTSHYSAFACLFSFLMLANLYSRASHYHNDLLLDIRDQELLTNEDLKADFSDYIDTQSETIASDLAMYCFNTIFLFQNNVSVLLSDQLKANIEQSLQELPVIFDTNFQETLTDDIASILIYDLADYTNYYTAFYYLFNPNPEESNDTGFYDSIDDFFEITSLDTFNHYEDAISSTILGYMQDNESFLSSLEFMSYKFRYEPLYFVNSHIVSHSIFASNLIKEMPIQIDVQPWRDLFPLKQYGESFIINYIYGHPFIYNDNVFKFICFYHFRKALLSLIDSKDFKLWVMKSLLPSIISVIDSNYLINISEYKFVDNICIFFKSKLVKDLYDDLVFTNYMSIFSQLFEQYLGEATLNLDQNTVRFVVSQIPNSSLENFLDSFYKSSVVSQYLTSILNNYSLK